MATCRLAFGFPTLLFSGSVLPRSSVPAKGWPDKNRGRRIVNKIDSFFCMVVQFLLFE
jgi:hypothetical protein